MTFAVAAEAYDRYMGRYSGPLAPRLLDFAGVSSAKRVLDVGCGPGALTSALVSMLGASAVSAVEPSAPFVAACRERFPGVEVAQAAAEELPFADDTFDASLAQLVVHFMADPDAGLAEMARVTRPGGIVAACVWDHAGDGGPLSAFWGIAGELDSAVVDESQLAGAREGHLVELLQAARLREVEQTVLSVAVEHPTFEDWWEPFTLGVGPAGAYVAGLDDAALERLRERCRERFPAPFEVVARAWAARGLV